MQIRYETMKLPMFQIASTVQQQDSLFNSSNQNLQVHRVDQTLLPAQVDSFVGCSLHCALHPPALNLELERERTKEEKEREVLHLFRCYTHTHTPGRSRVNPERQEEEKSGHTTGRRPKTAQGGEGNEPTYTAKRT